jgi:LemA protein
MLTHRSNVQPIRPRRGALSTGLIVLLVIVGLLFLVGACGVQSYNGLADKRTKVDANWSQIDNQYKRRYELVPNLVETVKGGAKFEQETLTAVVEARAKVGQAQLPSSVPTDPVQLQAYIAAQQGLSGALGRLFALSENYPALRATQGFLDLQAQLEGTENRIAVARKDYIDAVQAYNSQLARFPGNLIGGMFGHEERPQLSIPVEERAVPKVDFGAK